MVAETLLVNFLQGNQSELRRQQAELLAEQKRTNRLLQALIYAGVGFALGVVMIQFIIRVRVF